MSLNILTLLVLFLLYRINSSYLGSILPPKRAEPYKDCTIHLMNRLFETDQTVNFISENHKIVWVPQTIQHPFMVHVLEKPIKLVMKSYRNYIVYIDNADSLNVTLEKLKSSNIWDASESPRGTYIVATTSKQLKQIFQVLWNFDITNVILVSSEGTKKLPMLYTYTLLNCGQDIKIDFIQACNGNTKIIFNRATRNLSGCTIAVVERYRITKDLKLSGTTPGITSNVINLVGDVLI